VLLVRAKRRLRLVGEPQFVSLVRFQAGELSARGREGEKLKLLGSLVVCRARVDHGPFCQTFILS
jgi:hypothetical protein